MKNKNKEQKPKLAWAVFSLSNLKRMLAVAEQIQRKHGLMQTDSDCVVYGFEVWRDGQLCLESARAVASNQYYLPDNLMPVGESQRLMPYSGNFKPDPKS